MNLDWKEALSRLKEDPSLPQGDPESEEPTPAEVRPEKKETLHVSIERKGRHGKVATIIEGFTSPDFEVLETAAYLKKKLGVGGSARGGEILIQGDFASRVRELLCELGYRIK